MPLSREETQHCQQSYPDPLEIVHMHRRREVGRRLGKSLLRQHKLLRENRKSVRRAGSFDFQFLSWFAGWSEESSVTLPVMRRSAFLAPQTQQGLFIFHEHTGKGLCLDRSFLHPNIKQCILTVHLLCAHLCQAAREAQCLTRRNLTQKTSDRGSKVKPGGGPRSRDSFPPG